jgi:hypothetical protein
LPTKQSLEALMNSAEPDIDVCPTGSVQKLWLKNSYGKVRVESVLTDWIDVSYTETQAAAGQRYGKRGFSSFVW